MRRKNVPFLLFSLLILNSTSTTLILDTQGEAISEVNIGVKIGDKFEYVLDKFNYSNYNGALLIASSKERSIYLNQNEKILT